jgi:phosphatidyl-myo-inositol dimannoside synthase
MMKLLWIVNKFPPDMGGVQRYSYNTIMNFKRFKGVVLCAKNDGNTDEVDNTLTASGHKIIRSSFFPDDMGPFSLVWNIICFSRFFLQVYRIITKEKIDIAVFGNCTFFYLYTLPLLKLFCKLPVCLLFHGEDIPVIKFKSNSILRLLIKLANGYICNSNFTYKRLIQFLKKNIFAFIAFPGVEDKYFNKNRRQSFEEQFGISGKKIIYTVGRLDERKGHDLVIKILFLIISKFPDVIYLIAGTGPNLNSLKAEVVKYGLMEHVQFLGFVPDEEIVCLHGAGNIFVMPNRILDDGDTEGFGIVFLEASASGKPVIGGRAGGAVDAIEDGFSGYLVNPYNTEELVDRIEYLLSNPEKAEAMGQRGKQRAWNKFRWPYLVQKLEAELIRKYL